MINDQLKMCSRWTNLERWKAYAAVRVGRQEASTIISSNEGDGLQATGCLAAEEVEPGRLLGHWPGQRNADEAREELRRLQTPHNLV
jgi:hypothetical protein